MGLTSWHGSIIRKQDVGIAKNYLNAEEIKDLNEIVTMYLDYAERQARQRKTITMEQWSDKLDAFLEFNEQEILTHAGKVKAEVAKKVSEKQYDEFDKKRIIRQNRPFSFQRLAGMIHAPVAAERSTKNAVIGKGKITVKNFKRDSNDER